MKKEILFGVVAAACLGGAALLCFKKKTVDVDLPLVPVASEAGEKYASDSFPLKRNSGGTKVKELQKYLNRLLTVNGYGAIEEDGKFGAKTEEACVRIFGEKVCTEANFENLKNVMK